MRRAALCICVSFFLCGTVYAKVELEEGVNQLQNWDFEQWSLGFCLERVDDDEPGSPRCRIPAVWEIEDWAAGVMGAIELDDREVHSGSFSLKVTAIAIDGTAWHFKVKQDKLSLEGGESHTIKFWAKAEAPRVVQICLQMNREPWEGWLWQDVYLTEDWQEFVIQVTPPVDNDQEHWLAFHCGQSLVVWWLDDVRYYKGGPGDEREARPSVNGEGVEIETPSESKPAVLHVEGSKLKNADGHTVRLQGVNVASLEWSNTGDAQLLESIRVAVHDWNANAIRLPLSQDRWFGEAEGQNDGGRLYRLIVDEVVRYVGEKESYVILDLHWSDAGSWGKRIGQHCMPDMNSVDFWKSVAARYANEPAVLFDLYNEPHDVYWNIWKFGGSVREAGSVYTSPGMQGLLNVVRSTGAKNVIVAGGLDWGYNLRGIPKYALDDPFGNVMYSTHIYPWKGNEPDWNERVGHITGKYPIFVGEAGCEPDEKYDPYTWANEILSYIHKYELDWTAWDFHPSAGPSLIEDWTYTPTPYWGDFVKRALRPVPYIGNVIPPWDVNKDGKADILDFVLIAQSFGKVVIIPPYPNPDVNGDGKVNISDLILVGQHFGETYSSAAPSTNIWSFRE